MSNCDCLGVILTLFHLYTSLTYRERLETVESGQEVCLYHIPGPAHHQGLQGQDSVCHQGAARHTAAGSSGVKKRGTQMRVSCGVLYAIEDVISFRWDHLYLSKFLYDLIDLLNQVFIICMELNGYK